MFVADVSLLHGAFPETLSVLALLALAISSVRMGSHWWVKRVLPIVAVSLLIVIVVNWALDLRGQFDEVIPFEFLIWASMPLVGCGLAAFGWREHPRWQRAVSIAAIPLSLLYAANLINQFYGYEPTLGAVFGTDLNHQVGSDQLRLHSVSPGGVTIDGTPHTGSTGQTGRITLEGSKDGSGNSAGGNSNGGIGIGGNSAAGGQAGGNNAPGGAAGGNNASGAATSVATVGGASVTGPATPSNHGTISQIDIPGTVSGFNARPAFVWVPPVFFKQPRPPLPVVVMLAGVPGQPDNMIRAASADKAANLYASAHGGVAPIIIFPDANGSFTGDTECVDGVHGNAETYLTKDVPSFVSQSFGTLTGPTHWAIEGYSEGGTCAMDLALAHPDVFGTFVDIAGDQFPNLGTQGDAKATAIAKLYGGNAALFDAHDPMLLIKRPQDASVAGWFEVGTKDHRKGDVAATLDAALRAAGLQSQLTLIPGGHDFPMAALAVAGSFAWLSARVGV